MDSSSQNSMTSSRPYLIRALSEWILDNDMTPHIVVDAQHEDVVVPTQYVENGKIVLNVSPTAVRDLQVSNETLSFSARFSGQAMDVYMPIMAVLAIYARENGQGMVFADDESTPPSPDKPTSNATDKKNRPNLKLVK
jgi:stringent starvation protein B